MFPARESKQDPLLNNVGEFEPNLQHKWGKVLGRNCMCSNMQQVVLQICIKEGNLNS